jgi:hypothetical protein
MHSMIRKIVLAGSVVAFSAGMLAACVPTGSSGTLWVYEDANFKGGVRGFSADGVNLGDDYSFEDFGNGDGLNDEVSSVSNQTSKWAIFYYDANFVPHHAALCLAPGQSIASLNFGALDNNDEISSHDLEGKDGLIAHIYRCDIYKGANGWTGTGVVPTNSLP